jgi:hypothetical protein
MNILRYDDSTVKSILWKSDAAIEQVERIDGENAIRASEDGLVNSGLSAKAESAATAFQDSRETIVERLMHYRTATERARTIIKGTDSDAVSNFHSFRKLNGHS